MRRRRWRPYEITTMIDRYTKEGPKRLAQEFSRTKNSISSQARRYGQRTPRHSYQKIQSAVAFEQLIGER